MKIKIGDKAPDFELTDQNGKPFALSEIIGKQSLVIFFYPKAHTPGCTKEACKFRDEFEVFTDLDAMVIGISADSPESHTEFIEKYNLPFTLLSDAEDAVRKQFGVKGKFMDVIPGRVTFIADKQGVIQYVFDSMSNAEQHVEEAKKILETL
jgi:peroxiredoxin Q/BCP